MELDWRLGGFSSSLLCAPLVLFFGELKGTAKEKLGVSFYEGIYLLFVALKGHLKGKPLPFWGSPILTQTHWFD